MKKTKILSLLLLLILVFSSISVNAESHYYIVDGVTFSNYVKNDGIWFYQETPGGIMIVAYNGNETEVTIPEKINGMEVTAIQMWSIYEFRGGDDGFPIFKNKNIETLIIPKTITRFINTSDEYVSGETHSDLNHLKQYIVDENNPNFSSEDGVLFNKEKTELLSYPRKKENSEYVIPEEVTRICTGAFFRIGNSYNNGALKKITITKNVQKIGWPSGGESTFYIDNIVIDNVILDEEDFTDMVYYDDVYEGANVCKLFGTKEIVVYKNSNAHKYYKNFFKAEDISSSKLTVVANPYVKEESQKETSSKTTTSKNNSSKSQGTLSKTNQSSAPDNTENVASESLKAEEVTESEVLTIGATESKATENKNETNPKSTSKLWLIVVIAAAVVLAGGVTAYWFIMKKKKV